MEHDAEARRGFARMGFGCKHYRRRCRIRAPCCGDVFHCRHCHNESTKDGHELDRHDVQSVICLVCDTEQPVDKEQFHCDDCGICRCSRRKGELLPLPKVWILLLDDPSRQALLHRELDEEQLPHLLRGEAAYCLHLVHALRSSPLVTSAAAVGARQYLFDSLRETSVLRCGHTMHLQCFHEMLKHDKFSCPICATPIFDMDKFFKALDAEMEASYLYTGKGWVVCNDCRDTTQVFSGMAGHKCCHCQSHNTCRVAPPVLP
ncbi:E3 ubiquitin-protein ligase MIEL1 [Zea mays]|uniref:E3 ubiquitin-protein ligase MIEL1 n=1 Tax=Zea mays TaxID=4577 RepID=A0A1D6K2Z9_MAIZE|nr:E3 ubiquitin-protein ligase MIEL1 [Zea mays]